MDLSIIIVNYNTMKITRDCIESLFRSNTKVDYEIILVDNGSNDGSKAFFTELADKYKNLKYIYNNSNLGFSKANNIGIKNSVGDYTLLLNSDTLLNKKSNLEKLIEFAKSRENVGVIGARLLNKDGSIQDSCLNFPTIKRAINQYWKKTSRELDKFAPNEKKPITVDAVVGAAFFITPEAKKRVGLLDEKYFFFYEDIDYCRKIQRHGLKTFYHPDVEITHLHGASGKSLADEDNQWKRLIPSSKAYHGKLRHYVFNLIIWSGQKFKLK